ncbi:MAG: YHS domain-containing protein [Deferribacteraceae bacterium]|jgi:YHS domain-containing protein|nr:YHS domain-containing protein [Deferribacteraceae bacterium]
MIKIVVFLVSAGAFFMLVKSKFSPKSKKEDTKAIDTTDMEKDTICGTYVQSDTQYRLKYFDRVYYFCSNECLEKFKANHKEG